MVFHLFVVTSIVCMPLAAQEPRTEANSGVAEQFKRFDRDGNGRLSASEAGKAEFFRRADTDEDGVVTLAEAQSYARKSVAVARKRTAGMEGDGATAVLHWSVPPVTIPESECPVRTIEAEAPMVGPSGRGGGGRGVTPRCRRSSSSTAA